MRRQPAPPLDPATLPPTALFWLLLGLLGWSPRNGAFFGRFALDDDDERHVVYVDHYRRLDVRRLTAAVPPDRHASITSAVSGESAVQSHPATAATPPVLFRLGGYRYEASTGCMRDWHRRKVAALVFGTLQAPLLEQAGWHLPGHVLIAAGDEVERLHLLEAVDWSLCPEGHRPASTPAGSRWSHRLVGRPIAWWNRQQRHTWEDVRKVLRWRQQGTEQPEATRWRRGPELLIVAPAIECSFEQEIVRDLCAHGPGLGMHLLATTDQPYLLSPEQLQHFDTRLVLPGGETDDARSLHGASWAGSLATHEVLLAQFAVPEQASAVDGAAGQSAEDGTEPGAGMVPAGIRAGIPVVKAAGKATAAPIPESPLHTWPVGGDGEQSLCASVGTGAPVSGATPHRPSVVKTASTAPQSTSGPSPMVPVTAEEPSKSDVAQSGGHTASLGPSATLPPSIEVRCFGGFSVSCDGRELSNAQREREWAILGYLACQPASGVTKDRLGDIIWPGEDDADRGHRLGQSLFRLRDILATQVPGLPRGIVRTTRQGICRLDTHCVRSDAQQFLALLAAAKTAPEEQRLDLLEQAHQLVIGRLFQGERWAWLDERGDDALLPRQRFEQIWREVTWKLVKGHWQAGRPDPAIRVLRDLLRQQPTDTKAVSELFRLYAQSGDRQGLAQAYEEHAGELRQRPYPIDDEIAAEDMERARFHADAAYTAATELLSRKDMLAP